MLFLFIIIYKYNEHRQSYDAKRNLLEQTNEHATEELLQLN